MTGWNLNLAQEHPEQRWAILGWTVRADYHWMATLLDHLDAISKELAFEWVLRNHRGVFISLESL